MLTRPIRFALLAVHHCLSIGVSLRQSFHHSTSHFSSSYNSLNRLFHFLSPKKQYTPNTIHSPLAMFCNRFSMSLHLLHPELTAAFGTGPIRTCASPVRIPVFGRKKHGTHTQSSPVENQRLRVLLQKHALPRLTRMCSRPFLYFFYNVLGRYSLSQSRKMFPSNLIHSSVLFNKLHSIHIVNLLSHMSFPGLCKPCALPHIALPGGGVGPIHPGLFRQPLGLIRQERLATLPAGPAGEPVRAIFYAVAFHSYHILSCAV
uniref:Uncharacterized protein n=1 Tax=Podoviridae sp. ctDgT26 TaxID=2826547 RepID=A0A8S5LZC3_9CAUD|nr:MAG TPA: hypothetical protein [Podoviridae sp. ctDgT26]